MLREPTLTMLSNVIPEEVILTRKCPGGFDWLLARYFLISPGALKGMSLTVSGILYLSGQLLGAGLAGGVLRGAFGADRSIESAIIKLSASHL